MAAYNQALGEGYTPRQAKKMLYDNVVFLNERTIRRHLPLEARNIEKIRTGINTADNGPPKSTEKDPLQNNQERDQGKVRTSTISKEEYAAPTSSHMDILPSAMRIMKLENIMKNKDRYIVELLEKSEALNNENLKLKEEKQRLIDTHSGGVLQVKVNVSRLYTGLLIVREHKTSQAIMHISNGEYVKLEPA